MRSIASQTCPFVACLLLVFGLWVPTAASPIIGSGSTFIYPIMGTWTSTYWKEHHVQVNYDPIGSGAGISDIINSENDFGASDVPMTPAEKQDAGSSIVTIPDIIGAVAVVYHIPGVGPGVSLSGPVLAGIFSGKITYWDDFEITHLNPGTQFPHNRIVVVHRQDGSGTTAIFTDYLSKVSPIWASGPGTGKFVKWPTGVGVNRSAGIVGTVKQEENTISYVEISYAIKFRVFYAAIQNAGGAYVYPSSDSCAAAAVGISVPASLNISITNTRNKSGYPISGFSYLMVSQNAPKADAVRKFINWAITEGQVNKFTRPLGYAPIPPSVLAADQKALQQIK